MHMTVVDEITKLIRITQRIHIAHYGTIRELILILDQGGSRYTTEHARLPELMEWDGPIEDFLTALVPAPGMIPLNFRGAIFTASAWMLSAKTGDSQALAEMHSVTLNRKIKEHPERRSVQTTIGMDYDDNWCFIVQRNDEPAMEVLASNQSDNQTGLYKTATMSGVFVGLKTMIGRIRGDLDRQAMPG